MRIHLCVIQLASSKNKGMFLYNHNTIVTPKKMPRSGLLDWVVCLCVVFF